jgi:hypothetical protein
MFRVTAVSFFKVVGRDSSVGIATCYGPDCPGSNPERGEIFCIRADRPWGPPSLLYNAYMVIFLRVNQPDVTLIIVLSSADVKEKVMLELYYTFVP